MTLLKKIVDYENRIKLHTDAGINFISTQKQLTLTIINLFVINKLFYEKHQFNYQIQVII